jgi:hypothetical protein
MTQTYGSVGTMTATAPCELCGPMESPGFITFMELSPTRRNYKTISCRTEKGTLHWKIDWFQGMPCYISIQHWDMVNWSLVGTYDYDKNIVVATPASLEEKSSLFLLTQIMLQKFAEGKLNYVYDLL